MGGKEKLDWVNGICDTKLLERGRDKVGSKVFARVAFAAARAW